MGVATAKAFPRRKRQIVTRLKTFGEAECRALSTINVRYAPNVWTEDENFSTFGAPSFLGDIALTKRSLP